MKHSADNTVDARPGKDAALTIVSANYLSHAVTLCDSFKHFHPDKDFIIALVDDVSDEVLEMFPCAGRIVKITDFAIPDFSRMAYRYSVIELNTAVKPYILGRLFESALYGKIIYLDPDIELFHPLDAAYSALDAHSIALTPHITKPYFDGKSPGDHAILLSGAYNLGFLGIKDCASARNLLDWWKEKLFVDCVSDTGNGYFVDQRWLDLAPCFCPDHKIIFDDGYNVAYWNLHERRLSHIDGAWRANDVPLVFFHYSGYSPYLPWQLSRHQNRFHPEDSPELEALTLGYREKLLGNGYLFCSKLPYAFATLSNGTRLPMRIVRDIMQWAARNRVETPDPVDEPDAFCRFLMSRGVAPDFPDSILAFHFLLRARKDLLDVFPNALSHGNDPGFREWLALEGASGEQLVDLLAFEENETPYDYVQDAFDRLRRAQRSDVFDYFKGFWADDGLFDEFAEWFSTYGQEEMGFTKEHTEAFKGTRGNVTRIFSLYFSHWDIQAQHGNIAAPGGLVSFTAWLRRNRGSLKLSHEDISLFLEYARENASLMRKIVFLYHYAGPSTDRSTCPNLYDAARRCRELQLEDFTREITAWLANEEAMAPIDHHAAHFDSDAGTLDNPRACVIPEMTPEYNHDFMRSCRGAIDPADGAIKVNFAGYLNAPTGMGECSRSLLRTLFQPDIRLRAMTIPTRHTMPAPPPDNPFVFGWPQGYADVSLTVANADATDPANRFLPGVHRAKRNIGYWMWETAVLPRGMAKSHAFYDEIWTASSHSASAIEKATGKATAVVPIPLDFEALARARANRARFGLPERSTLFGFLFDPNSVLERKNIRAVIRAFLSSLRPDDDCLLVLKANGAARGNLEYETLRTMANDRVLFTECVLSREDTYDFLKSLDVYVSLHRSEGFGLTCAESMALGLPVIATGYSGNLDFMDSTNSILVPAEIIETDRAYGPYPAGTVWGDPDIAAAGAGMRALLNSDKRKSLGSAARQSIFQTLNPDRIANLVRSNLRSNLS
ncbi:Alpha-monoglucosyldiacylglycerol synthase [Fundidesulfovibrio magnetotacticus]|uniref:Alpha-monoglucosyldiacylglycerol synthase n=1 Tax=Fundidesulfovibrio magnetotacticus TaxID=2730080 RepID=A0A6V8LM50_9BACT|nr:glycosyltransferase [Fundidesulfovibrio magnetotacticus]GFK93752.1 Alpha-monoglucosyldiacylglycerol synthase [Fundidesulfovibrio magnetotacticus]